MIPVISLVFLVGLTSAAPQFSSPQIPILSQTQDGPNLDGSYQYSYETGDGKFHQERGYLIYPGTPDAGQAAEGSYSYTAPDGQVISVQYIANENGFQPRGAHILSQPPAIQV